MTTMRSARRHGAKIASLGVAFALLATACGGGSHSSAPSTAPAPPQAPATPAVSGPCSAPNPANPIFSHVSGNHLIDTNGRVMVPYGLTIAGLATRYWQRDSAQQSRQISAAISLWCTNYVRLQLSPAALLDQSPYDSAFLKTVESEVQLASSYDENVILDAQTEKYNNQPSDNPTQQIIQFWNVLGPIFKNNPRVWFETFNEPRLKQVPDVWAAWQHGATVGKTTYLGMQQVADTVRSIVGPSRLILVEGPHVGEDLSELPAHLITGANIAYAVHPYLQRNAATWNAKWGDVANTEPVIVDEWGEWNANGKHGSCSAKAPVYVPEFFTYLRTKQIGLGAWGFFPGVLITDFTTFTPTQLPSNYTCTPPNQSLNSAVLFNRQDNGGQPVSGAQGVGQLLQNYFRQYSRAS